MPVQDLPRSTISTLSPKELEVLQLLAAGHTAKSIAQRLGRSETSINERLRDARRKTGVGSSRELARLVAAQENWDRKIDLSPGAGPGHRPLEPRIMGPTWSKGLVLMIGILLSAAAIAFMGSPPQATAPVRSAPAAVTATPILGSWSLDTSRIPADERPRSVTLSFESGAEGTVNGKVDIVARDGSVQHAQSSARLDGPPVPLTGNMRFADMVSLRQPAAGTLVMTFEKDGKQVSTRVYTIEGDGNAMKETIVWAGDQRPRTVTTYFKRVGQ